MGSDPVSAGLSDGSSQGFVIEDAVELIGPWGGLGTVDEDCGIAICEHIEYGIGTGEYGYAEGHDLEQKRSDLAIALRHDEEIAASDERAVSAGIGYGRDSFEQFHLSERPPDFMFVGAGEFDEGVDLGHCADNAFEAGEHCVVGGDIACAAYYGDCDCGFGILENFPRLFW